MKSHSLPFLIGLAILTPGCRFDVGDNDTDKALSKVWMYQPGTSKNDAIDSLLSYTNFLELRPDGEFSSYLGKFATGRWSFEPEKQKLQLALEGGRILDIPVGKDDSGRLILKLPALAIPRFSPYPIPGGIFHPDDPFAPANNQWRVPARTRENRRQLLQRLESHCHFWVAYFKWADDNEVELQDLRSIPSPIKIYGNGFGLTHFKDEPHRWTANFYDSTDARNAYDLLRGVFARNDIRWPKTDNDYKRFAGGFLQVEEWLKKEESLK